MTRKITEKVTWVGKIDWELKKFHGNELSTHGAHLIMPIIETKTVLIDTCGNHMIRIC